MKEASEPFAWWLIEWMFASDVKVPKEAPIVPVEQEEAWDQIEG